MNPSLIIGTTLGLTLGLIVLGYGFYSEKKNPCGAVAEAYERAHDRAEYMSPAESASGLSRAEEFGIEMAGVVSEALNVSCLVEPEANQ